MINLADPLYIVNVLGNHYYKSMVPDDQSSGGNFIVNLGKKFGVARFVSRRGEWSLPWENDVLPQLIMPEYDDKFSKTFGQITDERALFFKEEIIRGKKIVVSYSGGIDSTLILSALIKHLTEKELKEVTVFANVDSIIENPRFWDKYVVRKFRVLDSSKFKYDDLIEKGYTPVIADLGDSIFGTIMATEMYNNYEYYLSELSGSVRANLQNLRHKVTSDEVHFSVYKDLIIKHFNLLDEPMFGKLLYEKYEHNVNTSGMKIHSLHDFFWWGMFSIKYVNCAVRNALYSNDRIPWKIALETITDWFGTVDYQKWAMNNNNNGQKIKQSVLSYKHAAKEYIWDFNKDDWYRSFKIKLDSGGPLVMSQKPNYYQLAGKTPARPQWERVGLTKNYEVMFDDDVLVKKFLSEKLLSFKIDWSDIR